MSGGGADVLARGAQRGRELSQGVVVPVLGGPSCGLTTAVLVVVDDGHVVLTAALDVDAPAVDAAAVDAADGVVGDQGQALRHGGFWHAGGRPIPQLASWRLELGVSVSQLATARRSRGARGTPGGAAVERRTATCPAAPAAPSRLSLTRPAQAPTLGRDAV